MKIRKNPARVSGGLVTAIALTLASAGSVQTAGAALVFQTDFSLKDGAVSAMKGVAFGGGTDRRGVVMRAKTGQLFVTPDNGTLTFVAETLGVAELREIDTARQRLKGSEASYTFHGRDVFAYVGARLAVGKLEFADVGPRVTNGVVSIPYTKAAMKDGALVGTIPVLDVQCGNVWSNIGQPLLDGLGATIGDRISFRVLKDGRVDHSGEVPHVATFGTVKEGDPLLFLNSLLEVSLALNMDSFAKKFGIGSGPGWGLEIRLKGKGSP